VREAARDIPGSNRQRAQRIARKVAEQALREVDDPAARVELLLAALGDRSPIAVLATDADIDTGAQIRAERARIMEGRGWCRVPEREWPAEDREIIRRTAERLARRYARHLQDF